MKALTQAKYFITKREAEDLLVHFISHPDSKLRATAVMHLGGVATRIDIDALSGFLEDSDNRVKANAIEVLDDLQEKQFIKLLNRFRQDANNRVRANALKALYNLGELDVKEDIRFMLMDPNPLMRASAVWVLGEIGTRAFYHLELLKLVMDDKDELVHKNLKLVLKKAGDIPQVEFLRDALEEPADTNGEFQSDLSSKLSVQERFYEPYCELILRGPLIARNQQKLEEVFSKAVEMDTKLILNFEQVGFIDDAGMRVLTDTNNIIKNKSGFMYIFNCNYRIMEIFQMTRQDKVLNIFQTLKEIRQFLGLESGGVL
jgi:anti-anti-sigma factor